MEWKVVIVRMLQTMAESSGWVMKAGLLFLAKALVGGGFLEGKLTYTGVAGASAPDDFKASIRMYLTGLIDRFVGNEFVKAILTEAIEAVTDGVLDKLWDRLFGTNVLATVDDASSAEFDALLA